MSRADHVTIYWLIGQVRKYQSIGQVISGKVGGTGSRLLERCRTSLTFHQAEEGAVISPETCVPDDHSLGSGLLHLSGRLLPVPLVVSAPHGRLDILPKPLRITLASRMFCQRPQQHPSPWQYPVFSWSDHPRIFMIAHYMPFSPTCLWARLFFFFFSSLNTCLSTTPGVYSHPFL